MGHRHQVCNLRIACSFNNVDTTTPTNSAFSRVKSRPLGVIVFKPSDARDNVVPHLEDSTEGHQTPNLFLNSLAGEIRFRVLWDRQFLFRIVDPLFGLRI